MEVVLPILFSFDVLSRKTGMSRLLLSCFILHSFSRKVIVFSFNDVYVSIILYIRNDKSLWQSVFCTFVI